MQQKKKTKKLIKFDRKPIQESNSIVISSSAQSEEPPRQRNTEKRQEISTKQEIQMPRSWKPDKCIEDIRQKLIGVLSAKQPLLSINSMFENAQLFRIFGEKSQAFKSTFDKKNRPSDDQLQNEKQRRDSANFGKIEDNIPQSQCLNFFEDQNLPIHLIDPFTQNYPPLQNYHTARQPLYYQQSNSSIKVPEYIPNQIVIPHEYHSDRNITTTNYLNMIMESDNQMEQSSHFGSQRYQGTLNSSQSEMPLMKSSQNQYVMRMMPRRHDENRVTIGSNISRQHYPRNLSVISEFHDDIQQR